MQQALIVIDIQNDYFEGGAFPLWNTANTLENIKQAIAKAKAKGMPIVLVQHVADKTAGLAPFFNEGTEGVELHKEILALAPQALIVKKSFADSFYQTELESTLTACKAEELIICGMMTQNCVTHTSISKSAEKYNICIIPECCTTVSEMIHLIALHGISTRVPLKTLDEVF